MASAGHYSLKSKSYTALIITLCACFLFYKYVLQIYPSIITQELMHDFHLSGAGLGNLAATFYYTYMVAQLVVGILLDRYSTRWLTTLAIFICALGAFIFSQSQDLFYALLARGLMGVGVAFATVAYMKLAAIWVPARFYALAGGLLVTAAMAGAVFGQAPLSYVISLCGWRTAIFYVGIAGIILGILFFICVRDHQPGSATAAAEKGFLPEPTRITLHDVLSVLKSPQNWLLTLYGGLAFSPVAIFGGLWGHPFIMQAYGLKATDAAFMVSLIFIGLGIGSPIIGFLCDFIKQRKWVMGINTFISLVSLVPLIYCPHLPAWLIGTLFFTFGFGSGSFMVSFTIGKEMNPAFLTATVVAMINTSDAILDAITEPAIGRILDLFWDGRMVNGVHYFALSSYHTALAVLPLYLLSSLIILFWIKTK